MATCGKIMRKILELSFSRSIQETERIWVEIGSHASQCESCAESLRAVCEGTIGKPLHGSMSDWGLDSSKLRSLLNAKLSRFAHEAQEWETEKIKESLEGGKELRPLSKRVHLLLLLLWSPGIKGVVNEGIRGITRIMKLLFLMKMDANLGRLVPDYYAFQPYHLGPFDRKVYEDLEALMERKVVEEEPPPSGVTETEWVDEGFDYDKAKDNTIYRLTPEGMKIAQAYMKGAQQLDPNILEIIREIKSVYGTMPLKSMIRYVYEKYPAYASKSKILNDILGSER